MNGEKDFFKTCFNTVVGLEVKNESQAIAKEVVLSEIEHLQQQVKKQKEVIDRLNFIKNRKNQGASQENINKMAIEFVNSYLKEVSE